MPDIIIPQNTIQTVPNGEYDVIVSKTYTGSIPRFIPLNPGTYNFRFTAAGYSNITTSLTLIRGQVNSYTANF